jgi:hypothetical protein
MKRACWFLSLCFSFRLLAGQPASAEIVNLFEDPGFEKKPAIAWIAKDSCRIALNGSIAHSGKSSLAFYPLTEGAGIRFDLSSLVKPGYRYAFSGWIRNAEAGWGQADFSLIYRQSGRTDKIAIGRADCNKGDWTQLSTSFQVPEQAEENGVELVIQTAWGKIAFLVDDLELRPALIIRALRPSGRIEPDLVFQIGPQAAERSRIRVKASVVDHLNKPVQKIDSPLDAPVKAALPAGFYRIAASAIDVDGRPFQDEKTFYVGSFETLTQDLAVRAGGILASKTIARYWGWIRYLQYRAADFQKTDGAESDRTLQALYRLDRWAQTIRQNPAALDTLSGVWEWAYFSRVDNSGQPFKIAIPSNYDRRKPYPLVVVMHGYSGNHLEHSGGVKSNPGFFELDVLGRGRGGGYTDLSESDVLDAVDYVRGNWRIDDNRIHLTGASMGGGGTFSLAVRYPDRWASGRPVCGYGMELPIANALHVPFYSTHSQDDPSVPVLGSRAPLKKLAQNGGQVVIDETTGLQHAAWNYTEGNDRAQRWMFSQVRPDPREVRRIDFTAVDRLSCRAYWLKIEEWGDYPGEAKFKATAGLDNQLYLTLENIHSLEIRVSQSPLDSKKELKISVNAGRLITMAAPLPDSVYVTENNGAWSISAGMGVHPPFEFHTPGGVHNLYHHEPLLIIYGTSGNEKTRQLMAQAAAAASKSYNPMWVGDGGDVKDGVPHNQLLYGHLNSKPDTAVTESDLRNCNLLLIGKAEENGIVRKMRDQLPVQFGKEIICSDGIRFPGERSIMGLYFYNPLSPGKLIYWVASDSSSGYRPYNMLLQFQNHPYGTDFLIVQENPPKILKMRHFDSRWKWSDTFKNSAFIPEKEITFGEVFRNMAESIRSVTASDFAMMAVQAPPQLRAGIPGTLQWADIAMIDPTIPIAVFEMKGSLILSHQKGFSDGGGRIRFYPPAGEKTYPDKTYRIALPASFDLIRSLINLQNHVPDNFEITDFTIFEAMKQRLF